MDPEILCPGKGLVLPNISIDTIATNSRFLILSLPNHEMSQKSPFAIQKALKGIGGDPKSVKKLRSGDLLIETVSALQTKSFLSAKVFLDCPLIVTHHRSLNSCRGIISEPDLLCASEAEILEGLSDQGVTQVRRIKIKKDSSLSPTKHLILTFNSPKLPSTIKAGYLNFSTSSTQAHLLRSTSTISKSQPHIPKIPVSNDLPSVTIPERSLNILKVLSNTLWGADRVSLLRVYHALILSRLDYGCAVYGSARASVLKRLDTIHHSALRICSGAFRTSPVTSLYVVCHQPPLELRRRQLCANYFIRAMSVPSHPLKPFALAIGLNRLYEARSFNIKPFSERAKAVLNDAHLNHINIQENNIFAFPPGTSNF
ncbi:putative RNA-directed DNA polymerase from transposon X-element [Trichonephila clavipes]|nr:putative RNA-directed DNA polymerase from transposon X-element [Trichonephila clavipes]